ncbi:MAG: HEAT repeat domain-containing protein [Deltaproteobacteria bacterium]|nr:HEAT repeat domain-containing protein [Deltaproteobacteria bacterium]
MADTSSFVELLGSPDPEHRRDACVEIGASGRAEYIPELVSALKDEDLGVKEAAINALTIIRGSKVAEAVIPLLKSEDAALRNIGVEILGGLGSDGLGPILTLLNDPDDDVVKFAVDIIAGIEDAAHASGALLPLLSHRNPNVRASAALCLGHIKAAGAARFIAKSLSDSEEWVRFSAIEGLGLLEDRASLSALLAFVEEDCGPAKDAALEAASRIAAPSDSAEILDKVECLIKAGRMIPAGAVVELLEKAVLPGSRFRPPQGLKDTLFVFFSRCLDDEELSVRLSGVKGLKLLRAEEGITRILAYADTLNEIDEDTEALLVDAVAAIAGHGKLPAALPSALKKGGRNAEIAVKALGITRSPEAAALLEGLVRSDGSRMRQVVTSIASIGSPDSVEAIRRLLMSSDGHTRKTAARALAAVSGEDAVQCLFVALKNERYRDVMEEITDSLSSVPAPSVLKGFCSLAGEEDETLREMGIRGLGHVGDESAFEHLRSAAKDRCPSVRKAAYRSMGMLGMDGLARDIAAGIKDMDADVRLSAVKGLSGCSGDIVKRALVLALKDADIWVRYHAVLLLGSLDAPDCEALIAKTLEEDEAPVKAAAARALELLGAVNSVRVLEGFKDHPDPNVKEAVERALETLKC